MSDIYGDGATLGNDATLGYGATPGYGATSGDWATLGDGVTLGDRATLGNGVTLGDWATLGYGVTLGDGVTLGYGVTLGDGVMLGKKLTSEGVKVRALMTMANVDGSGRRVHIYVHTNGIIVRAGCFKGDLDEFCQKATKEGKTRYARVIRAAAEALKDDADQKGDMGGWDEEIKSTEGKK
jgi:NDP-sugar pyrophosphorylase family protein